MEQMQKLSSFKQILDETMLCVAPQSPTIIQRGSLIVIILLILLLGQEGFLASSNLAHTNINSSQRLQCRTSKQIKDGSWKRAQVNGTLAPSGHAGSCPVSNVNQIYSIDSYHWEPKTCSLLAWNAELFCKLLGNRRILLVGDSTMGQSATVLMNAVSTSGCHANISFASGDTLIGENLGLLNRGKRWTEYVKDLQPNITILTAGAHVSKWTDFETMIDTVLRDIWQMRTEHPDMKVLWKTQQPGGCSAVPLDILPTPEYWKNYSGTVFNYNQFLERDGLAKARMQVTDVPVIDMEMLYYRTDAHPGSLGSSNDCLHFCMPGPLDLFPVLTHHAFLEYHI